MFNIVLYQPEIPPNTGNIIRLGVNTDCKIHLIEPLGFTLDDKHLKRAGLDYKEKLEVICYASFDEYVKSVQDKDRVFLCTTKATTVYSDIKYQSNDSFVFGPETRGLPEKLLKEYPNNQKIIIPMSKNGRSLNLATSVSVIVYEALRQQNFKSIL